MDPITPQGQDGLPFLSFFDRRHGLSFVLDGTRGLWIDVCQGGAGEPLTARIPLTFDPSCHPLATALVLFAEDCQSFVETIFGGK